MDLTTIPRNLTAGELELKPLSMSDDEGMFMMLSDAESMKYWSDPPISDISDARKVLRQDLDSDAKGNSLCWAIFLKGQKTMIGKCILFQFSHANRRAEIGYILNRTYWRRGLTYQALKAMIEFAFNTLNLHRIEADVDTENTGSLAVLEKLGFQREGLFRDRWCVYGEWQDSVMLALLKNS